MGCLRMLIHCCWASNSHPLFRSKLSKSELMQMVKFGADQIISGKRGAYTDEDIDALIAKGEKKTDELQALLKKDAQHNLASFTLTGDMDKSEKDTFDFGGDNYRDKRKDDSLFIDMGTRERKRAKYDVNEYFKTTMNAGADTSGMKAHAADAKKKKRKGPVMQDFQLYDRDRLEELSTRERELAQQKEEHLAMISELRKRIPNAPPASVGPMMDEAKEMEGMLNQFVLTPAEQEEKEQLLSEGFTDWVSSKGGQGSLHYCLLFSFVVCFLCSRGRTLSPSATPLRSMVVMRLKRSSTMLHRKLAKLKMTSKSTTWHFGKLEGWRGFSELFF